jgi:hypothetical protein
MPLSWKLSDVKLFYLTWVRIGERNRVRHHFNLIFEEVVPDLKDTID